MIDRAGGARSRQAYVAARPTGEEGGEKLWPHSCDVSALPDLQRIAGHTGVDKLPDDEAGITFRFN